MAIIGKTQRDVRRRRALAEEYSSSEAGLSASKQTNSPVVSKHKYARAALAENLPQITDFIPKRNWSLLVFALSGLALVCLFGLGNLVHLERQSRSTEVLEIRGCNEHLSRQCLEDIDKPGRARSVEFRTDVVDEE